MVKRIYSNARMTLVWLSVEGRVLDNGKVWRTMAKRVPTGPQEIKTAHVEPLKQFFRHEYWQRTWIVQEIWLAKTVIPFTEQDLWLHWQKVLNFLPGAYDVFVWMSDEAPAASGLWALRYFKQNLDAQGKTDRAMSLISVLDLCPDTECSEPRNAIYGFLAIASSSGISVDYDKSIFEILLDLEAHSLRQRKAVSHMSIRNRLADRMGLASLQLEAWMAMLSEIGSRYEQRSEVPSILRVVDKSA